MINQASAPFNPSATFTPDASASFHLAAPEFKISAAGFQPSDQPFNPQSFDSNVPQKTQKKTRRGKKTDNAEKCRKRAIKGLTPSQAQAQFGIDVAKYKTEMCKNWIEIGTCRYGQKCQFAHGPEELGTQGLPKEAIGGGGVNLYRSKPCQSFNSTLICVYGQRCLFAHEDREFDEIHERFYTC